MSDKFTEREKSFEKKFVRDEELQFKVQARSNKYIAEFVSNKLNFYLKSSLARFKAFSISLLISESSILIEAS